MTAPGKNPQGRSPWSAPIVLASAAIGIVILAASVVVGLVAIKPSHHSSNNGTPTVTTVTATSDRTTTRSTTAVTTTTTTAIPGGTPGAITFQQPSVPNTDRHGFTDGGPRCNVVGDPVAMVIVTSRSRAIICQVGRTTDLYYKDLRTGRASPSTTRRGRTPAGSSPRTMAPPT